MYERFSQLLLERGLTAYKFSQATGISQSTLSEWKSGKIVPKVDKLQIIADFFCVSVDYLLGDSQVDTNMVFSMNDNSFASQLLLLRKSMNVTQDQLAGLLGFSKSQISNYEQSIREPSFHVLKKFADLFGVSTDFLLGRTELRGPAASPVLGSMALDKTLNKYVTEFEQLNTKLLNNFKGELKEIIQEMLKNKNEGL
jgi:transcriptional regulator with XRE-family HTH domain